MRTILSLFIILLLSGCEFLFGNFDKQGEVEIYATSVPRAELSQAQLSITGIELQHSAGQWHTLKVEDNLQPINLQHISPDDPLLLAQQDKLPEGEYTHVRLHFDNLAGEATVRSTGGVFPLYTTNNLSAEIHPRFTLKKDGKETLLAALDLHKALAYYEDDAEWYYRLESTALAATPKNTGYLYGHIAEEAWQNLDCEEAQFGDNDERINSYVYLYQDRQQNVDQLPDLQLNQAEAPIATAAVMEQENGQTSYRFAPMPSGDYLIALTCHGEQDHPNWQDKEVLISTGERLRLENSKLKHDIN